MTNEELVSSIIESGYLKTKRIIDAFRAVGRAYFVPENKKRQAYDDIALGIGYGATISQPSTVAFLLEKLQPKKGEKILEIGTGSGYVTALLSVLAGEKGKIFSVEYIPELIEVAQKNLELFKKNFPQPEKLGRINLIAGDGRLGLPQQAPFDKIISGASASEIPFAWKEQLKNGGVIVTPFDDSIIKIRKSKNKYQIKKFPGFVFVKLQ